MDIKYVGLILMIQLRISNSNPYINYNCIKKNGEMGICKELEQCATAQKIINANLRTSISFTLCGYLEEKTIICCGDVNEFVVPVRKHFANKDIRPHEKNCKIYSEEKRRMENLRNEIRLSNKFQCSDRTCRENFTDFGLINEDFPHMAQIGWEMENKEIAWKCRGSLIGNEAVLTSAHCIDYHNKELDLWKPNFILLGINNHVKISIDYVEIHPKFVTNQIYNDIAIIKFTIPIKFNLEIRPACLSSNPNVISQRVLGFGKEKEWTSSIYLNLETYTMEKCRNSYPSDNSTLPSGLVESQFCAGNRMHSDDFCQMEAGNPLQVWKNRHLKMYEIIGFASLGMTDCNSERGTVYTNISHYIDWIEEKVWPGDVKIQNKIKLNLSGTKNGYTYTG